MSSLYIGKTVDDAKYELDPADLTTHGLCIGMTGSGKTGLCVTMIEELRLARIPCLILDPKGDMCNLALAFSDLEMDDFLPWIDQGKARKAGMLPMDYAIKTAKQWKAGLKKDGIDGERIREMNQTCPVSILTPGAIAGEPVNVLSGLALEETDDPQLRGELIKTAVGALLQLLGIHSDPLTGREYILLSNLIDYCWEQKQPASLERLIAFVQNPPIKRVGIFAVDSFYPPKDRMELALKLNALVASPGFEVWTKGEPLEIDHLLYLPDGRPRCTVLYLAHLSEAQRMFVTSLVLTRLTAWMRRQPGSQSLKALLYIDEAFGLVPPYPANPPSKNALLTLYKQARAFGLGVMLSTQNPVDLDYKVMSNAGLWMIGKLSTDNDRRRVLEGLKGAAGISKEADGMIAGLGKRQFFIRNIHEKAPVTIRSRFAMSYLRGPLTLPELQKLTGPVTFTSEPVKEKDELPTLLQPPQINGIRNYFLDPSAYREQQIGELLRSGQKGIEEGTLYQPAFYASVQLRYDDTKADLLFDETIGRFVFPLNEMDRLPDYNGETTAPDVTAFFNDHPANHPHFMPLPPFLDDAGELEQAGKGFADTLYRNRSLPLYRNEELKLFSRPGQSKDDFIAACQDKADELVKQELEKRQDKADRTLDRLEEKRRRILGRIDDASEDTRARDMESVASVLESAAGFLFGRRRSVGRAVSSTMRRRRMANKSRRRREQYESDLEALKDQIEDLHDELEDTEIELAEKYEAKAAKVEKYEVPLERNDIRVVEIALVWVPVL